MSMAMAVFLWWDLIKLYLPERFQAQALLLTRWAQAQETQNILAGTFTTDIITATLTGTSETTDTNGIIVLRDRLIRHYASICHCNSNSNSNPSTCSAHIRQFRQRFTSSRFSNFRGHRRSSDYPKLKSAQEQKFKQAKNRMVGFNYPDNGGTVYLGANSDAGWVYLEPQTDPLTGNITYTVVPSPATGSVPFERGGI